MYCQFCGATIDDDAVFCSKCGKRLASDGGGKVENVLIVLVICLLVLSVISVFLPFTVFDANKLSNDFKSSVEEEYGVTIYVGVVLVPHYYY